MGWNDERVVSSDDEPYDSDRIDSDIEAELYSVVHHKLETVRSTGETATSKATLNSSKICDTIETKDCLNDTKLLSLNQNFETFEDNINNVIIKDRNSINPFAKQKSNLISNLLQNIQSDSERKNISNSITLEPIRENHNQVINLDSSDEDSDIIWTSPEEGKNNFEINLLQSTIDLDSESNDSCLFKFTNDEATLCVDKTKDPWFINTEDLYRSRRNSGRYHESKFMNCSKCNLKGHLARFCPSFEIRKCFICGNIHMPNKCKHQICLKCHQIGHDYRFCKKPISNCSRCGFIGHSVETCPDIWRKYQLTTTKKLVHAKRLHQSTPLYCYNCGQQGHFGGECKEYRMNNGYFATWPTVIENQSCTQFTRKRKSNCIEILKKLKKKKKKLNNSRNDSVIQEGTVSFMDNFLTGKEIAKINTKKKRKERRRLKNIATRQLEEDHQELEFQRTPKSKRLQMCNNTVNNSESTPAEIRKLIKKQKINQRRLKRRKQAKQLRQAMRGKSDMTGVLSANNNFS